MTYERLALGRTGASLAAKLRRCRGSRYLPQPVTAFCMGAARGAVWYDRISEQLLRPHGAPLARARDCVLYPLSILSHECSRAPITRPGESFVFVGPEGHPWFSHRVFRPFTLPVTGPVRRHSRPGSQQYSTPSPGPVGLLGFRPRGVHLLVAAISCFPPSEL